MRTVDIRLPATYLQILEHFGSLQEVIAKALQAVEAGLLPPIETLPAAPATAQPYCKRLVTVDNPTYEELVDLYGAHSSRVSLRRLLTYIVDNEAYTSLGWQPLHRVDKLYSERISSTIHTLQRLLTSAPASDQMPLLQCIHILEDLR